MKTTDNGRSLAGPSRWQKRWEYVNAVFAISSWGLHGPRGWLIDEQVRELLSQVMPRTRVEEKLPARTVTPTAAPPAPALAGCCCGCAAS